MSGFGRSSSVWLWRIAGIGQAGFSGKLSCELQIITRAGPGQPLG
jgi:hypothetical protein